jgi:multidrug efflux pump subunit AcrA (membrane-fusion protein)
LQKDIEVRYMRFGCAVELAVLTVFLAGCEQYSPKAEAAGGESRVSVPAEHTVPARKQVRATGTVYAVKVYSVQVPQITGQGGRMTLTRFVPNGSKVNQGDVLAEFDRTQQLDNAREAQAKFDDLSHQVEQRKAQNRSEAEKRGADLLKAEADQAKARLQLTKGSLLSEIDRLKAETKASDAEARVASLQRSNRFNDEAAAAALRILELQRDRQKVSLERAETNARKLIIRAPLAGMVALENVWRNGSMGHAQEGDQLFTGQPLLRIFDPSEMQIRMNVAEPDGSVLVAGVRALVHLDAYPEIEFHAVFESASPVAASALGSPIKTFDARFRLQEIDPHLLPDMSAAVIIRGEDKP